MIALVYITNRRNKFHFVTTYYIPTIVLKLLFLHVLTRFYRCGHFRRLLKATSSILTTYLSDDVIVHVMKFVIALVSINRCLGLRINVVSFTCLRPPLTSEVGIRQRLWFSKISGLEEMTGCIDNLSNVCLSFDQQPFSLTLARQKSVKYLLV